MMNQKAVRSALLLLALSGTIAACSPNSGSHSPQAPSANSMDGSGTILSQEVTQKASLKIASITDDKGRVVPDSELATMAGETVAGALSQLRSADRAVVSREAVQLDGAVAERVVIDLRDKAGSIIQLHGDASLNQLTVASSRAAFPASQVEVARNKGKISQMLFRLENGKLNVVVAFGAEQQEAKQQEAKQEEAKQQEAKQEEAKQQEAKQEEAKQQEAKQEEAKQEFPKQEEAKQEMPKQEEAKQEEAKQEMPKQEEAKQEEAKQEEVKQESPKQEEAKQEAKQEQAPGKYEQGPGQK